MYGEFKPPDGFIIGLAEGDLHSSSGGRIKIIAGLPSKPCGAGPVVHPIYFHNTPPDLRFVRCEA
jgi:hypothetical protein